MIKNMPLRHIKSIGEYHQFMGHPKPEHPLISVINLKSIKHFPFKEPMSLVYDFHCIALKRTPNARYKYGQQEYDFDDGVMFFQSPKQVFGIEVERYSESRPTGWALLVHPDFFWNTPLAKTIKQYRYFDYSVNEALHLSEKEEAAITNIIKNIEQEYRSNIDAFSQDVMVAQIELLLHYSNRFYNRQFITRKKASSDLLVKLEDLLTEYFVLQNESQAGLPTVKYVADKLNVSPNYLSDMLRTLTGQSTQQHIHDKVIEKTKEILTTTALSVGETAYQLGFETLQSFNKLFKNKTDVSPLEYRNSFIN